MLIVAMAIIMVPIERFIGFWSLWLNWLSFNDVAVDIACGFVSALLHVFI